jgi:hypothetical protein
MSPQTPGASAHAHPWRGRRRALAAAAAVLLALLILAMSLSQLEFQPGESVHFAAPGNLGGDYGTLSGGEILFYLMQAVYALSLVAAVIYIIYMLVDPARRRQLLKSLTRILLLLAVIFLLSQFTRSCSRVQEQQVIIATPQANATSSAPAATFTPSSPSWAGLAAGILLALLASGAAAWYLLTRTSRQSQPESPLPDLGEQAEQALAALDAGIDLKNACWCRCWQRRSWGEISSLPRSFYPWNTLPGWVSSPDA